MRDERIKRKKEITYDTAPKDEEMKNMNKKLRVMEVRLRNSNYIQEEFLDEKTSENRRGNS